MPWVPRPNAEIASLINKIVIGEESDTVSDGLTLSHYELYLKAMLEVGADTSASEEFVAKLKNGLHYT